VGCRVVVVGWQRSAPCGMLPILRDCEPKSAIYPSDHYPVLATLGLVS
jgi:hypothetical protein